MAKGAFPESHELHFGWPGMHGPKWSNWALNKCDLLVAVGARFDDRVTGKLSAFAPGATVVHLDIDSAEIGKLRQADIPVVGPLKQVLADLAASCAQLHASRRRCPGPSRGCASSPPGATSSRSATAASGRRRCKPQLVLETLAGARPPASDVVWTTGVGQHQMWAMQYLLCDRPRSFITSGGLGDDGLRPAGRDRREGGAARGDGRLRRRRRLLPDDRPGARDRGARATSRSSS